MMLVRKVIQVGNCIGITIPKTMIRHFNIKQGQLLHFSLKKKVSKDVQKKL